MINLGIEQESFRLAEVFTISRGSRTEAQVVTVRLSDGDVSAQGECVPYARYGETLDSVVAQIESIRSDIEQGLGVQELQQKLPAGAARNAVDCALWDLAAKRAGKAVWELAGLVRPEPIVTAYTLSLADPDSMREKAAEHAARPLLKIKLGGEGDIARLEAVRAGAPAARIIVDANEGWTREQYQELAPVLLELGVSMVEQPFPAADDAVLADMQRPLPVCADESCHDVATLPALAGKYDMINIKLDKTGGLTEALRLRDAAQAQGYDVMVGCMIGTSLAMAPATLVAQGVSVVDLDGPLLLAEDREPPLSFDLSTIAPVAPALWG